VAEIVLEMIALIFQRIERLIFDAPASPCLGCRMFYPVLAKSSAVFVSGF
jgi:hypothetical protein